MICSASLYQDGLLKWWELGRILTNQKLYLRGPSHFKVGDRISANSVQNSPDLLPCWRRIMATRTVGGRGGHHGVCQTVMIHQVSLTCVSRVSISRYFCGRVIVIVPRPLIVYYLPQHCLSSPNSRSSCIASSQLLTLSLKIYKPNLTESLTSKLTSQRTAFPDTDQHSTVVAQTPNSRMPFSTR